MASVDDRIVRLEFDNSSFERKISQTLASLGDLDKALKFTGATKGFDDISQAAGKLDFHSISQGIENVSAKFIALGTIAINILSEITQKALQAGEQLIKAFAIQPVLDGFREYETNMNSIQTILANTASKGTTLDQVTAALDKLNQFSDQTIYNFAQMAKNVGTFTAAGVDLQTSVDSIKGIANLAAMSGSSADQASMAMYQLSQAIASGTLKLIDWNSVVNAGMGGEAFKSALFETGKALHTLTDVPLDMTFKQWEDGGNSFRDSLQDGWITADVLTTTLQAFTGDMTEEMLLQKGFSEAQALNILKTAQIAKAAATEVKTFTQLVGTVREAIGTGWADSFRIVIGNFTEAKALWTDVNNSISGFVQKSADARNEILQGWKDMGGRTLLIESLKTAFHNLGLVLEPIKEAFRTIFPPTTAQTLYNLTTAFSRLATALAPTQHTVDTIRSVFQGFFAVLSIGWEIIKEGTKFFIGLAKSLLGIVSPEVTGFFIKIGEGLTKLQEALVKGGGIKDFFANLTQVLQKPLEFLEKIKEAIINLFSGFKSDVADKVGESMGRFGDRFESLKSVFSSAGRLWEPFKDALEKIVTVLDSIWEVIRDWFKELGQKLAKVMNKGDFDAVLDAINTGLLGGIVLLLTKFFKSGFKLDLGGGFFEKISGVLDQVTASLKAMQLNIKADALLKIAGAIAILTASVLVLSMIDSEALTKALSAMAVGFGELMATFTILTKIVDDPKQAASFTILSAGLILLAGAILILSLAVAIMGQLSWEELLKGLTGLTVLLVGLSLAVEPLSANSSGMIQAGIGITAIGVGLLVLSVAMKILATMSWEEMAKGLTGVAGGLGTIVAAIQLMPEKAKMIETGVGIIAIAVGMLLLAASMKIFSHMDWEEISKGLIGVAGALGIIVGAMHLMPPNMAASAASLVLVGLALIEIATAMKMIAKMKWEEIGKGIGVIAVALGILIGTMYAITGAIAGAATLVIITAALAGFAVVLKMYAAMKIMDIVKGLTEIAVVLGLLALASWALSESIPVLLLFGAALALIGIGIAGIGAGIYLAAKGFEIFAEAAMKVNKVLPDLLKSIGEALPALATGLAKGIVEFVRVFLEAAPVFAKLIGTLIEHIVDTIIILIPKIGIAVGLLIDEFIRLINEKAQPLIEAGFFLFMQLLKGLREHIDDIVKVVADIIVKFLEALEKEIPRIAEAIAQLIITAFTQAAEKIGEVSGTLFLGIGLAFITGFVNGLESNVGPLISWLGELPGKIVTWIGDTATTLVSKGSDLIQGILNGINSIIGTVTSFFGGLPGQIFTWIGDTLGTLASRGSDLIQGLLNGVNSIIGTVTSFFSGLATDVFNWVGDTLGTLVSRGNDLLTGLWNGIWSVWGTITNFFSGIGEAVAGFFKNAINWLVGVGNDIMQGLWNGMKAIWNNVKSWIDEKVAEAKNLLTHPWEVLHSPSEFTKKLGREIMEGWHIGMKEGWKDVDRFLSNLNATDSINPRLIDEMVKMFSDMLHNMNDMDEFNPVITPVLDMTRIKEDAGAIKEYLKTSEKFTPTFSTSNRQAQAIQREQIENTRRNTYSDPVYPRLEERGVKFEQNIYSPTQLSTSDIYKQTRNQITIAKEELSIP